MIEISIVLRAERLQAALNSAPFIGPKLPFIGSPIPGIGPFIGYNQPFVGNQPFVATHKYSIGFTLVELLITLVIAGILLGLAVPQMTAFIQRDRLVTQANELVADLSFARSEAIKRGTNVIVCKSNDLDQPIPSCNATLADPWTSGRVIWVDLPPANGAIGAGEVLRVREQLDGADNHDNRLLGDGDANGTGTRLVFTGLGTTTRANLAGAATTQWRLCDKRGASHGVAIAINIMGHARVTKKGEDKDGAALVCPPTTPTP